MISERGAARAATGVAAASLAAAGLFAVGNPDTFGHLAQGRQIAALGRVPHRDPFSVWRPEAAPWANYEWLSDLTTWWAYQAGGFDALIVIKCALLACAGALCVELARREGGPRAALLAALLICAAIPAARFRFSARPHLVALPLASFYLLACRRLLCGAPARAGGTVLWVGSLGLAHVLWVNLHGSHLLGLGVVALATALALLQGGHARRTLPVALALQLLASCASPFGPRILLDAVEHVLNPAYRGLVQEWAGADLRTPSWIRVAPLLQGAALTLAARPLWGRGPAGRLLLLVSLALCALALRSVRFVAEFLLLSSPAVAAAAQPRLRALPKARALGGAGLLAAGLCAAVPWGAARLPPMRGPGLGAHWERLPAASGLWLDRYLPTPRLLASIEDAWFLLYAAPRTRVVQDGRVPFYGPEHIAAVRAAIAQPTTLLPPLLERFRVNAVVVQHTSAHHRALLGWLARQDGWQLATVEDRHALYIARGATLAPSAPPALRALPAGYDPDAVLLASEAALARLQGELARLPEAESNRGYKAWIQALRTLRDLQRPGRHNGLRRPADAAEVNAVRSALPKLSLAAQRAGGVPLVDAYHALAAVLVCDLTDARRALERAEREGQSRETLLIGQQLALREGRVAPVRRFLEAAAARPEARGDPWLEALRRESARSPTELCPSAPGS